MKRILTVLVLLTSMITAQEDSLKVYKSGLYLGAFWNLSSLYDNNRQIDCNS